MIGRNLVGKADLTPQNGQSSRTPSRKTNAARPPLRPRSRFTIRTRPSGSKPVHTHQLARPLPRGKHSNTARLIMRPHADLGSASSLSTIFWKPSFPVPLQQARSRLPYLFSPGLQKPQSRQYAEHLRGGAGLGRCVGEVRNWGLFVCRVWLGRARESILAEMRGGRVRRGRGNKVASYMPMFAWGKIGKCIGVACHVNL